MDVPILRSNNPNNSTTAVSRTPFVNFLTDDGSDASLAEDYSGAATDWYWQSPGDALIYNFSLSFGLGSITQSTALANTLIGVGSANNGFKFGIKNPSGTLILDISNGITLANTLQLMAFGSNSDLLYSGFNSSTAANNEVLLNVQVDCVAKFGGAIFLGRNHRFVCTVNNNFSGLDDVRAIVAGCYV